MRQIILEGPNGIRKVPEDFPYRLEAGEFVVGSEASFETSDNERSLAALANENGIAWGDMIAAATKVLGIKPCSSCEKRRQIMNEVNKLGVAKAFGLIKATFKA